MSRAGRPQAARKPSPEDIASIRRALLEHYDRTRRDLPWRGDSDPYRIWVSEVMLQQTRVETVTGYYRRWLERFPDLESLANATPDEVLMAWQGLGYYRRARNLHAGANVVRERHGGAVPSSFEALRALPGVGEYTAGALASIAFGEAVPAVDGNVRRVLARLHDRPAPTPSWLRDVAALLVDPIRPGDWNQALMELGATVCTPREPACDTCPLRSRCRSRMAGTQRERPAPARKKAVPRKAFATAVLVDPLGRVLVVRRPEDGLLGGLWSFPDASVKRDGEVVTAARRVAVESGVCVQDRRIRTRLEPVSHRFTHLEATYHPVVLAVALAASAADGENRCWIPLEPPHEVALPVAQQKIAKAATAALKARRRAKGARCASKT
jgi:A/G-specific adenine glycosylase